MDDAATLLFRVSSLGSANPPALAGWDSSYNRGCRASRVAAIRYGMQVSYCMDYEISFFCAERRRGAAVSGAVARNCAEPGDENPRRRDQSGPRAHAGVDTSQSVGVEGGAVLEGEKFTQAAVGICLVAEAILGPAFVGAGVLGGFKRQCTDDMWQRYIEDQKPDTPDDHFKVV